MHDMIDVCNLELDKARYQSVLKANKHCPTNCILVMMKIAPNGRSLIPIWRFPSSIVIRYCLQLCYILFLAHDIDYSKEYYLYWLNLYYAINVILV